MPMARMTTGLWNWGVSGRKCDVNHSWYRDPCLNSCRYGTTLEFCYLSLFSLLHMFDIKCSIVFLLL